MSTPNCDSLKAFMERRERLESVKQDAADDIKELNAEIKGAGFDLKPFNIVIARRKRDASDLSEEDAIVDMYLVATGSN
jgi:uncharacterized protein (UPF0335 family)